MAFNRLVLMAKSGEVGNIKAVEATCTQMTPPPVGYQKGGFGVWQYGDHLDYCLYFQFWEQIIKNVIW